MENTDIPNERVISTDFRKQLAANFLSVEVLRVVGWIINSLVIFAIIGLLQFNTKMIDVVFLSEGLIFINAAVFLLIYSIVYIFWIKERNHEVEMLLVSVFSLIGLFFLSAAIDSWQHMWAIAILVFLVVFISWLDIFPNKLPQFVSSFVLFGKGFLLPILFPLALVFSIIGIVIFFFSFSANILFGLALIPAFTPLFYVKLFFKSIIRIKGPKANPAYYGAISFVLLLVAFGLIDLFFQSTVCDAFIEGFLFDVFF